MRYLLPDRTETFPPNEQPSRNMLEKLISAVDEERRQLAHDLHDELGQMLSSLSIGMAGLEAEIEDKDKKATIKELRQLLTLIQEEIIKITKTIHPCLLENLGFKSAIEQLVYDFKKLYKIPTDLKIYDIRKNKKYIEEKIEITFYRILQEILVTLVEIKVKRIKITLRTGKNSLSMVVKWLFKYDTPYIIDIPESLERTRLLGGGFRIKKRNKKGTITASVPLE